jgi:uncharacterized protein (TIGR02246 family)
MQRHIVPAALALSLALAGITWVSARDPKAAAPTLTPQDYAEIQHLTARLNQGADSHDSQMWVALWTPDGVWTSPEGRAYTGHKELAEYRRARREELGGRTDIRHWTNSLVVTPTADGATGRSYYVMMKVNAAPPMPMAAGHYDDVYTKTSSGWRIKRRTIYSYPKEVAITPTAP